MKENVFHLAQMVIMETILVFVYHVMRIVKLVSEHLQLNVALA